MLRKRGPGWRRMHSFTSPSRATTSVEASEREVGIGPRITRKRGPHRMSALLAKKGWDRSGINIRDIVYDFDGVHIFATRARVGLQSAYFRKLVHFSACGVQIFANTRRVCKLLTRVRKQSKLFYKLKTRNQTGRRPNGCSNNQKTGAA